MGSWIDGIGLRPQSCQILLKPSSVCLSSVCNAHTAYTDGYTFRQFFYGHALTCIKELWRSSQGNPSVGRDKPQRNSKIQRFWTYRRLYLGNGAIGGKLVLITYRKSQMSFRLVPKSVTLNDLERRIMVVSLRYFSEFDSFRGALHKSG